MIFGTFSPLVNSGVLLLLVWHPGSRLAPFRFLPRFQKLEFRAMAGEIAEIGQVAFEQEELPHSPTPSSKTKADDQSPFPPTQVVPPTPNSSPTQGSGQGSPAAEGPALVSSHWGFNIKRAKVPGQGAGASEPVQSSLAALRNSAAYTEAASGFCDACVPFLAVCRSRFQDAPRTWTR